MSLAPEQLARFEEVADEVSSEVEKIYESDPSLAALMRNKYYHGFLTSAPKWIQDIAKKNPLHDMIGLALNTLVSDEGSIKLKILEELEGTIRRLSASAKPVEKFMEEYYINSFRAIVDIVKEIKAQKERHESSDEYVDAPRGGPLGRTAFSKNRLDDAPRNEDDTRLERELYDDLSDYVLSNVPIKDRLGAEIQDLVRGGSYPKIFKAPKSGTTVYRGMGVSDKWLIDVLGRDEDYILPELGEKKASFVYKPVSGDSSSWSLEKSQAERFAKRAHAGRYAVVISADVGENPDSFLDMNDGLYNVTPMKKYSNEVEVLGIGNIKAYKLEWKKLGV